MQNELYRQFLQFVNYFSDNYRNKKKKVTVKLLTVYIRLKVKILKYALLQIVTEYFSHIMKL